MSEILKIGTMEVNQGELKFGFINTFEMKNGVKTQIPVMVLRGNQNGPTLTITTVVHGKEFSSLEIIRRVLREEINPEDVSGTIIAVLVSNPVAFEHESYHTLQDNVNLSRAFIGDPNGTSTQRMANAIWKNALSKSDYVIDIHNNSQPCLAFILINQDLTDDPKIREKAYKIAEAFGLTIINRNLLKGTHLPSTPTTMSVPASCMREGIPAITVELIEGPRILEHNMTIGVRGLLNVMKAIGMIKGKIEKQSDIRVIKGSNSFYGTLKANRGGILHTLVEPGVKISKDTVVARILNVFGDEVEAVKMPIEGYFWCFPLGTQAVTEGKNIGFIFYPNN